MSVRFTFPVFFCAGLLILNGCQKRSVSANSGQAEPLRIVATVYPLADVAQNIGGKWVKVDWLLEGGRRVQGYVPSPAAMDKLRHADLVITSGYEERWADAELSQEYKDEHVIRPENSQIILDLAHRENMKNVPGPYWLDPAVVGELIDTIRDRLIGMDPIHETDYRRNADDYHQKLQTLLAEHGVSLALSPVLPPSRREDVMSGLSDRSMVARGPGLLTGTRLSDASVEKRWILPAAATPDSPQTRPDSRLFSFLSTREYWYPLAQRCNCQEIAPVNSDPWLLTDTDIAQIDRLAERARTPWLVADANWPKPMLDHLAEQTGLKLLLLDPLGTPPSDPSTTAPTLGTYPALKDAPPRHTYLELLRYNLHQLEAARRAKN